MTDDMQWFQQKMDEELHRQYDKKVRHDFLVSLLAGEGPVDLSLLALDAQLEDDK